MVRQDKVLYDDRPHRVRSNPVGGISSNCAMGAIGTLLIRFWLPGIPLMTMVIEFFAIVLSVLAAWLGIRGLLLARKRDLVSTGALTGLMIGLATLILIPLVVFVLKPARRSARQSEVCVGNLELLGGAAKGYAAKYPDRPVALTPQHLVAMEPANGLNAVHLICPLDPDAPDRNTKGDDSSYAWIAEQPFGNPDHVLAYCDCNVHGEGTNVLMADGTVRFLSAASLSEALGKTHAAIEAAARPSPVTVRVN